MDFTDWAATIPHEHHWDLTAEDCDCGDGQCIIRCACGAEERICEEDQ